MTDTLATRLRTVRLELGFRAETADDAQRQAREWANMKGSAYRLRTIASVRRNPAHDAPHVAPAWLVTVVVVPR